MKKCIAAVFLLFLIASAFVGCGPNVPEHQREAYENCLEYIKDSSFIRKDYVNPNIVSIRTLEDHEKDYVNVVSEDMKESFQDEGTEYWLFTIGSTSGHDFMIIVCNSETDEVIGTIPIA